MWFKTILRRNQRHTARQRDPGALLLDESFLLRLERLNIQAQRALRGNPSSGEHPSRHRLPTTIFSDHRPYSAGDDYRYVDWNAYARHEQVVVRLGEVEQDIDVHVLVDVSNSMAWGGPSKLFAAQQLAAGLGYLAMSHSDRLRISPFCEGVLPAFGVAQSKSRVPEMMRFIADLRPAGTTVLARAIAEYARAHPRGGLIAICSDLLAPPADGLAEVLRMLPPPRWQVLVLHILHEHELRPDLSGPIELEDSETRQRIDLTLDAETLAAYRRAVAAWQDQIALACSQRGATYAPVLAHWPMERMVVPYLRLRQVLR